MKKFIFFVLIVTVNFDSMLFAVKSKPRMTKTVVPHYSGISGRRYYMPTYEEHNEPLIIDGANLNVSEYLINPINSQTPEDIAIERNRRMRALQLQRSQKRPYGVKAYYFGSEADLPVGATPSTEIY